MAAVTVSNQRVRHVIGDLVTRFFTISGVTGSTLDTGMVAGTIAIVIIQQSTTAGTVSLITSFSISGATITFASSAPMVNERIMVIARKG